MARGHARPFTDQPGPVYRGPHPERTPRTRGGVWSPQALEGVAQQGLFASLSPAPPIIHTTPVAPEPGPSYPWEGSYDSGDPGGSVNTATGNKLTRIPLVSWKCRGGMSVDFTLFHNSESNYHDELGYHWTWTYDIYLNLSSPSTAVVHWGDGLCVPYSVSGGTYTPPTGVHDALVKNANGTYTITRKDQSKIHLNTSGFCDQVQDRNGNTITITLNGGNYATAITDPSGRQLTISVDANNKFQSITDPDSHTWTFTHDASDDLTVVSWPVLASTDRCTQQTFGSGAYTAYGYDTRNRLTALDHKTSAAVLISAESYGYDSASNLTSKTVDSVATSYGYDWVDQLTSESRTGYSASYTYDANGNRASKTLGVVTETYHVNDVDELTSITRPGWLTPVKSYTYDDAGRTTSVVSSAGTTSLSYDYEGRLTQITYPSTATNTFTYNALDTRVGKVDSAGTATYKRDGVDVTDPVLSDGAAAYTPGISERRSSATKYLHEDFLGSTTRLTDSSQATTRSTSGVGRRSRASRP